MSADPKHIITDLEDLFKGIVASIETTLSGVVAAGNVELAFKDERPNAEADLPMPRATVYMYDTRPGSRRRTGGDGRTWTYNAGTGVATVTLKPVPVDLFVQIDTYAITNEDQWAIQQKMLPRFDIQQQLKVVTPLGREFYLTFQTWQHLDEIESENWFRVAWRCRIEIWFASPNTPPSDAYVVLTRKLNMLGETWTMPDVA